MTQYIDKDALVAEIEKLKSGLSPNFYEYDYDAAKVELLEKFENFIDTLEVKEVNLEKHIDEIFFRHTLKEADKLTHKQLSVLAKHFFELGLSVSNKIQKE